MKINVGVVEVEHDRAAITGIEKAANLSLHDMSKLFAKACKFVEEKDQDGYERFIDKLIEEYGDHGAIYVTEMIDAMMMAIFDFRSQSTGVVLIKAILKEEK